MTFVLELIAFVIGVGAFFMLLRHYRRQRDFEEPPGKVPEDY
ncbi:MAG TPA: hypothetical protein VF221_14960 [Chloroflexota bacterium]